MSLADELLADLEDDNDDVDLEDVIKKEVDSDNEGKKFKIIFFKLILFKHFYFILELTIEPEDEELEFEEKMEIDVKVDSVRDLCKLRDSERLKKILVDIEKYSGKVRETAEMIGNVESDPEYQLIVEANNVAVEIDNEVCK